MICQNLPCRSPHRTGYYFAGPALEGTLCGDHSVCVGGECLIVSEIDRGTLGDPSIDGGWSGWSAEECSSGCLIASKGYQKRHRACTNPIPINGGDDCQGLAFDVTLCDDQGVCGRSRYLTTDDYASIKCGEFSQLIPELEGPGIQALHEEQRLWVSCSIFCRRKDIPIYYSPRLDLNDVGKSHDAYFPDGTFCHDDGQQNYYCLHHHCLPENFKFAKDHTDYPGLILEDDIPYWMGNAAPDDEDSDGNGRLNDMLMEYMSLSDRGTPLRTRIDRTNGQLSGGPKDWYFGENDVMGRGKEVNDLYFE